MGRTGHAVRWTGIVLALGPVLGYAVVQATGLALPGWSDSPVVLASVPIAAPVLAGVVLVEAMALGLLVVASALAYRGRTSRPAGSTSEVISAPGRRRGLQILRRGARVAATIVVVLVALATGTVALAGQVIDTPALVGTASSSGCRVLVVDHDFLLLGSGDVYAVPPGFVTAVHHVGGYTTDDGYSPVAEGTVRVVWTGESAHVAVWSNDPDRSGAWSGTVSCS
jgi:hypothetical protein